MIPGIDRQEVGLALYESSLLGARFAVFFHFILEGYNNALWSVYLPEQQTQLDLSDGMIGAASLFNYGGQVFATVLAAWLLRNVGSRSSTFLGALMFSSSMFVIPLATNFGQLSLSFLAFGVFEGIMDVSMNSCAVLTESVRQAPLLGTYHGTYSVSAAVGSLIGGLYITQGLSQQLAYSVSGSVAIVLAGFAFLAMYSHKDEMIIVSLAAALKGAPLEAATPLAKDGHGSDGEDGEGGPRLWEQGYGSGEVQHLDGENENLQDSPLPAPARTRRLLLVLSLVGFLASFGEGAVVTWITIFFTRSFTQAPGGLYSIGFSTFMVCMALGRFCCDALRQLVGRRAMCQAAGVLSSTGLLLVALSPKVSDETVGWACLGCATAGLGLSTLIPTVFSSAGHLPGVHSGTAISQVRPVSPRLDLEAALRKCLIPRLPLSLHLSIYLSITLLIVPGRLLHLRRQHRVAAANRSPERRHGLPLARIRDAVPHAPPRLAPRPLRAPRGGTPARRSGGRGSQGRYTVLASRERELGSPLLVVANCGSGEEEREVCPARLVLDTQRKCSAAQPGYSTDPIALATNPELTNAVAFVKSTPVCCFYFVVVDRVFF